MAYKRNNPGGVRGCFFVEFYQSDQDPENFNVLFINLYHIDAFTPLKVA